MQIQGQSQIADSHIGELVRLALTLKDDERDARLGAIQRVIDAGQFEDPSMYRLISIEEIRGRFPRLPAWDDLIGIGRRLRLRILALLRQILCSGEAIWEGARAVLDLAVGKAVEVVAEAIAVALIGAGIVATVAVLTAVILAAVLSARAMALSCAWLAQYMAELASV